MPAIRYRFAADKLLPESNQSIFAYGIGSLNADEWRGHPPGSCSITNYTSNGAGGGPEVIVEWRSDDYVSFMTGVRFEGWKAVQELRNAERNFVDASGAVLPDGQPPVYRKQELGERISFATFNFGQLLEQSEAGIVEIVDYKEFEQRLASPKPGTRGGVGFGAPFAVARRARPQFKLMLTKSTDAALQSSHQDIQILSSEHPQLERLIVEAITKAFAGFLEGRVGMLAMQLGDEAFVDLGSTLTDMSPQEEGFDPWEDVLSSYTPTSFLEHLAKYAMANYWVSAKIVRGERLGLLLSPVKLD